MGRQSLGPTMCKDWKDYSIRKQLLIAFLGISVGTLALSGITTLVTISLVTDGVIADIKNELISQSATDRNETIFYGAKLFDGKLRETPESFLNIICYMMENSFRQDHALGPIVSYYDWHEALAPPVVYDARYNTYVSYSHSSYNVYNKSLDDVVAGLSAGTVERVQRTVSVEMVMRALYEAYNPVFLSGYVGLGADGLFREYPGATDTVTQNLVEYDPRQEDWYVTAEDTVNTMVYTVPYFDPYVRQNMITTSRTLHHVETGDVIGVCGADMVISVIQRAITPIKYLGRGRTILFDVPSGLIVADSGGSPQRETPYSELRNPTLTAGVWDAITGQGVGRSASLEVDGYYLQSLRLETADSQYLILNLVAREVVTDNLKPILDGIYDVLRDYFATSGSVFVAMVIVIVVVILLLANWIIGPVHRLTKATKQIIGNVGSKDMGRGVDLDELKKSTGIVEMDQLNGQVVGIVESRRVIERRDSVVGGLNQHYDPQFVSQIPVEYQVSPAPVQFHPSQPIHMAPIPQGPAGLPAYFHQSQPQPGPHVVTIVPTPAPAWSPNGSRY